MAEDVHYLTASEALALFHARALSPVELMQATIDRIEAVDGEVQPAEASGFVGLLYTVDRELVGRILLVLGHESG